MLTQVEARIPRLNDTGTDFPSDIEAKGLPLEIAVSSWHGSGQDDSGLPRARAFVAHDNQAIFIRFKVRESQVRAVNTKTQEPVWQDSCVEFFFSLGDESNPTSNGSTGSAGYYNLECNAIGTILYYFGADRHTRIPADSSTTAVITTGSSLGKMPFDTKNGPIDWQVDLRLPVSAFFNHRIWAREGLSGKTLRANLYKCGDKLPRPHYLSWQRIASEKPDFHRPEFFSALRFD